MWLSKFSSRFPLAGLFLASSCLTIAPNAYGSEVNHDRLGEILNTTQAVERLMGKDQINNIFQLRDVNPDDWSFDALRNLVDRYNCLQGYPDRSFRGNRPLNRYEFAAGLNACMGKLEAMIAGGKDVDPGDLENLRRMMQGFRSELAALGTRVDDLEGRTNVLADRQFSTTTKLNGEAIFALTDSFGNGDTNQTVFADRLRLTLETSFTGKDLLATRLAGGNLNSFNDLASTTQTFNGDSGNGLGVDFLIYDFPVNAKVQAVVGVTGASHTDYSDTIDRFEDSDGGNGALSLFASDSPIYRIGGGAGLGLTWKQIFPSLFKAGANLRVGYLADNPANPTAGSGLTNGDYSALAQLDFALGKRASLGLTYIHGYHSAGNPIFDTGSGTAQVGTLPTTIAQNLNSNTWGVEAAWDLSDRLSFSGFGGWTKVNGGGAKGDIWTYGGGFTFRDLGKTGSLLGLFAGSPPHLSQATAIAFDGETPFHLEGFYRYPINDHLSLTPGVIWVNKPDGDVTGENSMVIGTLRTTFTF